MKKFNIFIGVINVLSFIFLLFPGLLKEVLKMDPYKLALICIFIACLIYWGYSLIAYSINKRIQPNKKQSEQLRNKIIIRSIGEQMNQSLDGKTLAEKWKIKPNIFRKIVNDELIIPESDANSLDFLKGFMGGENEIDEDVVFRLRFKPKEIIKFEKIAKNYTTIEE